MTMRNNEACDYKASLKNAFGDACVAHCFFHIDFFHINFFLLSTFFRKKVIMSYREHTKVIQIGDRVIGGGGGNPILIQSMTNTPTEDVEATVEQTLRLEQAGCEIIRCTCPTEEAARAIGEIKKRIHIPLVADIHFDYRMAIMAMENGADKIRINPGNIGGRDKIEAVVKSTIKAAIKIIDIIHLIHDVFIIRCCLAAFRYITIRKCDIIRRCKSFFDEIRICILIIITHNHESLLNMIVYLLPYIVARIFIHKIVRRKI